MATLKFVIQIKDSKLLLLGIVEEGESATYTVNSDTYESIGSLTSGDFVDETSLETIKYNDEYIRAKKKALSILAFADNNRRNLLMKLQRAGYSREIAETVCEEMVALGYINELRQLEIVILNEANGKLRGPMKIIASLSAKGYNSRDIREAMNNLIESGEVDFERNKELLLEKKMTSDDEEEKKKILYKNGYKV